MYRLVDKIKKSNVILFIRNRKTYNNSVVDDIIFSLCDKIDMKQISIDSFEELKKTKIDKNSIIKNNYKFCEVIHQYFAWSDNFSNTFFNSEFNSIIQNIYINNEKIIFKDDFNDNHHSKYNYYRYFDLVLLIENDGIRVIKSRYDTITIDNEIFPITQMLRKSKLKKLENI